MKPGDFNKFVCGFAACGAVRDAIAADFMVCIAGLILAALNGVWGWWIMPRQDKLDRAYNATQQE